MRESQKEHSQLNYITLNIEVTKEESASVAWRGEKQQSEMDFEPGDVSLLPPGHDAWVVGDEPFVAIDIQGMTHYAEPPKKA